MDCRGDIGLWQRRIAGCQKGTSRRLAVFEALNIRSSQSGPVIIHNHIHDIGKLIFSQ
jgi:hypothetical protein